MKARSLTVFLVSVLILSAVLPLSILADDFGSKYDSIKYDVKALSAVPVLDGVIVENEYHKVTFEKDQYCVAVNAGRTNEEAWAMEYEYFTGWHFDGVYVAVKQKTDVYANKPKDDGSESPWWWHAVGFGIAEKNDSKQTETWVYRRSDTGEIKAMQTVAGDVPQIEAKNAAIKYANGYLTYEVLIPWSSIRADKAAMSEGGTFKMTVSVGVGVGVKCVKAIGGGVEPLPKGPQYFATLTLTGKPAVETTAAAAQAQAPAKPAAASPQTADIALPAALLGAVVSAVPAVSAAKSNKSKKRR